MKPLNIPYFLSRTIRCADPWLISRCSAISFTVTRRFSFTMTSTAAMPSGVTTGCAWPGRGESVTELMLFTNFLVHSYTCYSDRHASPYWTFIRRWISMGFTPSLPKKWITERCSSLVHVASGDAIFTLLLRRSVEFCIVLPPVGHSSNYHITAVNWQKIELRFEFFFAHLRIHLTLTRIKNHVYAKTIARQTAVYVKGMNKDSNNTKVSKRKEANTYIAGLPLSFQGREEREGCLFPSWLGPEPRTE